MAVQDRTFETSASADPSLDDLKTLRQLLLGPDYDRVLSNLLSQTEMERVAAILSEAVIQRNRRDRSLADALAPIIDEVLGNSIRDKPQRITSVIYPIMGPAIRKSVAATLADMVQVLNQVLESSLTVRAWKWRYQAWRAGVGYGQYVLLKTLEFRVEQVFLIHRGTGILLHTEHSDDIVGEDPDLVSSMLVAISDFVADSFGGSRDNSLDNVRIGDFLLEIETGPRAILVAAVRGTPSEVVRNALREALERIHLVFARELDSFDGDRDPFSSVAETLQHCLLQRYKTPAKTSVPWLALSFIAILLALLSFSGYRTIQSERSATMIAQQIRSTPGYLVTGETKNANALEFDVLRAPSSISPQQLLSTLTTSPWEVRIQDRVAPLEMDDYLLPLLPDLLQLSPAVKLNASDGILKVEGELGQAELERLQQNLLVQSAFRKVDISDITLRPGLSIEEQKRHQWFAVKARIEATRFLFQPNSATLSAGEQEKIPALLEDLNTLPELAEVLGIGDWQIYIVGYADSVGSSRSNRNISEERATLLRELLQANGVDSRFLLAWGVGHREGSRLPAEYQRMVSLQLLSSAPGHTAARSIDLLDEG